MGWPLTALRTERRLSPFPDNPGRATVGDAAVIEAEDASFDAVFDFGTVHHAPDWRPAVAEIGRVLRPGGRFFFEGVTSHALARWTCRTFLEHPKWDRFSAAQLVAGLERQGIEVGSRFVTRFFGDFVIGVGRRQAGPDPLEV